MTSRGLLRLVLRRWYFVLIGVAITLAFAWSTIDRPGVYFTQFNVVLLPPAYEDFPNNLEDSRYALAPLAGLVVTDFNGSHRPLLTASSETTLYGEGERSGVLVRMPNLGTQWQLLYPVPNIDVQIVDSTAESVARQAREVSTELNVLLTKRQDELGVIPSMRVTAVASAADPAIAYVHGSRARALGAIVAVGFVSTIVFIYWIDRLWVRRRPIIDNSEPDPLLRHALQTLS